MLSLSTELTETEGELSMLLGNTSSVESCEIPLARELIDFAEAMISRDDHRLQSARERLSASGGEPALVTAATVAANFQRMVRIADATGIPIDADRMPLMAPAIEQLQLRRFAAASNTPPMEGWRRLLSPLLRWVGLRRLRNVDQQVREQEPN